AHTGLPGRGGQGRHRPGEDDGVGVEEEEDVAPGPGGAQVAAPGETGVAAGVDGGDAGPAGEFGRRAAGIAVDDHHDLGAVAVLEHRLHALEQLLAVVVGDD